MPEAKEYLTENKELEVFIKKFNDLDTDSAKALRTKLEELNLIKLGDKDVVKIIDILPEDQEDLNKVLTDIKLEDDEARKVLETIKEFR